MAQLTMLETIRAWLTPRECFTIRTYLQPGEVINRVKDVIKPYGIFQVPDRSKPYYGEVSRSIFAVRRRFGFGRGAHLPWVEGKLRSEDGQTIVEIVIEQEGIIRYSLLVFYGIMTAFCLFTLGWALIRLMSDPGGGAALLLVPGILIVMLAATIGVINGACGIEAARSKRFFRELLEDIGEG